LSNKNSYAAASLIFKQSGTFSKLSWDTKVNGSNRQDFLQAG